LKPEKHSKTVPSKTRTRSRHPSSESISELRIAIAQINTVVGDFKGNADKIRQSFKQAKKIQANIVLFPELSLTGYPPEDLLLKESFIRKNYDTLQSLAPHTQGLTAIIGYVESDKNALYNSAALLANGKILASYRKMLLPNYGVFDEKRYFSEGQTLIRFTQKGVTLGITICEDIWQAEGPGKVLCQEGAVDILVNISSSPYHKGKGEARENMIKQRAKQYSAYIAYANLVGAQDELVYDGHSLIVDSKGNLIAQGQPFEEEMIFADLSVLPKISKLSSQKTSSAKIKTYRIGQLAETKKPKPPLPARRVRKLTEEEEIYSALVLGTRDYITKNGFHQAVIGLSGGIDSALTAAIAKDAIGSLNVIGVLMPSPYSSKGSVDDSLELAASLNIRTLTLPIAPAMRGYDEILSEAFKGTPRGIAEENLQARIRGNLLMALSNKNGWLVLTTGNKSEFSVGYCTLYGDMAGGFAVLKDVPKTWVYDLAQWLNRHQGKQVIPENIIVKEPSAELRPNQKDTDSLPPYSLLDAVLSRYIEEDQGLEQLQGLGLTKSEIKRIVAQVDANEYKRRQGPPGVKITPKSFGKDRRLPITNHFKG